MSTWPDHLSKVLVDLRFIANIKENEKPCFNKRTYVSTDSWYGSLYRMINNESGRDSHQRIRSILHDSMNQYDASRNDEHKSVLVDHIKRAMKGIGNLIHTYERHPEVEDNLEILSTEIKKWLFKVDKSYELENPPSPISP